MTPADHYKHRIKQSVDSWYQAAADGKDRPRRKSSFTEAPEQARVVKWLDDHHIRFFHVPNAGKRNPQTARSQGIRAGVPDLIITTPPPTGNYRGVAVEMKKSHGGSASMDQLDWIDWLRADGWAVKVCAGAPDAISWLEGLGFGR